LQLRKKLLQEATNTRRGRVYPVVKNKKKSSNFIVNSECLQDERK